MLFQPSLAADATNPSTLPAVQLWVRPSGSRCNLACSYCHCRGAVAARPGELCRMSPEVLARLLDEQLGATGGPLELGWTGGEPLLAGREFFEQVALRQRSLAPGRVLTNVVATNATLVTEEFAGFFAQHGWRVIVGLDGPGKLHDACRSDPGGGGSFRRAMRGVELLRRHGVPFETHTVISRHNAQRPVELYTWLRDTGAQRIWFSPLLERTGATAGGAGPDAGPLLTRSGAEAALTVESVRAARYGEFLCTLFDAWHTDPSPGVTVGWSEGASWDRARAPAAAGLGGGVPGAGLIVDHDGAVYPEERALRPEQRLGSLLTEPRGWLARLVQERGGTAAGGAGRQTADTALATACHECPWRAACGGGNPRHRFVVTAPGERGLSYLCPAYKRFFQHQARVPAELPVPAPRSKARPAKPDASAPVAAKARPRASAERTAAAKRAR